MIVHESSTHGDGGRRPSRRAVLASGIASGVAFASAAAGTNPAAAATAPTGRRRPDHVILIDWDGFDRRYLEWFDLPNLKELIRRGSYGVARGNFKAISNPSRASMVTGAWPTVHGNFAYAYNPETGRVQGQSRFLAAETLTQRLAAEGMNTASVGWYMVDNYGNTYGNPEHPYILPPSPFEDRANVVIDILNGRPVDSGGQTITLPGIPPFIAAYGAEADALGHREGPNSPNMEATVTGLDAQLGRIIAETERVGIADRTAFIVTTDHGMSAWSKAALPQATAAIEALGFTTERLGSNGIPSPGTDVVLVAFVHTLNVHLLGDLATAENRNRIARALDALPEIQEVFNTRRLHTLHAHPVEDLVAETAFPYAFGHSGQDLPPGEEAGSHSGLNESLCPLVLAGVGVKAGKRMHDPRIIDVAPTAAALLGSGPPAQAQGRALSEILSC